MDVYSTAFTYPRRSRHLHSPADFQGTEARPHVADSYTATHLQQVNNNISDLPTQSDIDAVQKLSLVAMTLHACHVHFLLADHGRGWNFHITGAYQQVMIARGMILKECPVQVDLPYRLTVVTF
jgi:hypothetical protein